MNWCKFKAALVTIPAFLTPLGGMLAGDLKISWRSMTASLVAGVISACIALKAYLSSEWADANRTDTSK